MSSFDTQKPTNIVHTDHREKFLSCNLSPEQEKILKFLKKYFPHAADFYKAGISHFLNKNMPARLSILSHCFFELSSVLAQTDVNRQKEEMQKILKKTLKNIDFKQENWKEELKKQLKTNLNDLNLDKQDEIVDYIVNFMREIVQTIREGDALKDNMLNTLYLGLKEKIEILMKNKSSKIHTNINKVHPSAVKERTDYVVKIFKKTYNNFGKMRHYNITDYQESNIKNYEKELQNMTKELDDALYNIFIPYYDECKKILDNILQEANKEPYKSPEDDKLEQKTIDVIDYWTGNLREYFFSKLKNPEWVKLLKEKNQLRYSLTSDEHHTYWHWDAFPYLLEIANKKTDEVFDVIKPFWDEAKQDKRFICFLSKIIEIGITISKVKKEHLFSIAKDFLSYLKNSISPLSSFYFDVKHIANLLKTLVDFGYEKEVLEIFLECLKLDIKIKDDEFVIVTKFGCDNDITSYIYDKFLNKSSEVFQQKDKKLFEICCNIIKDSLNSLSNEEHKEFLNNNINYIDICLRRVIEVGVQEANEKQTSLYVIILALRKVAKKMMRADRDFVLNKLRKHEEKNKIFLYLIFNLLGLPLKIQKPSQRDDDNICNNSELSLKLLNKYEKDKYEHIYEHIKFFSSSSVEYGFPLPLKDHQMQKKSVDEIIEFLNGKYEQGAIDSREGIVLALEKDVKQNSRKYLDDLLKFKDSNIKPVYIMNLFSGLNGVKENDWANIADIGLWALKRRMPLATSISVDENWNDVYIELLRLFSKELFKSEGLQVDDKVAKVIYNIIKELTFSPDGHLLSKELKANYSGLKYIEAATNSLHGNAMSGLIEYATWQHKNKKNISYIIPE